MVRQRMTGRARREQLIKIGRELFAQRGFDGTTVEDIAAHAGVTKPVIYDHFGGKEGLYAVIVDREMLHIERVITTALESGGSRERIEKAILALLTYVEEETEGFRILVRDSPMRSAPSHATLLNETVGQVSYILAGTFQELGFDPDLAIVYGQALVGMLSLTAQWWLDDRTLPKEDVARHLVNMCWHGLHCLEADPQLSQAALDSVKKPPSFSDAPGTPTAP